MALLPETNGATYPTPRQIENGEAQAGGINGLWNEHAKAMIERTNWLGAGIAALQNAGGYKSALTFSGNQTLTANDAGKCYIYLDTTAVTLTLPLIAVTPVGSIFEVINTGTANVTVQRAGSDQIDIGPSGVSSIVIPPNQSLKLIRATGSSLWHPVSVTAAGLATSFGSSLGTAGWQRLPSGLIMQWGVANYSVAGVSNTFPIAFPSAVFRVATFDDSSGAGVSVSVSSMSTTGFVAYGGSTQGGGYIALGN